MEKKLKKLAYSNAYYIESEKVYAYGLELFGEILANLFFERLQKIVDELEYQYDLHPECKYLPTKGKIYRNIIFGKYLLFTGSPPPK